MADLRALEHSTLKVPYEILNKKFRFAQKAIDREVDAVHKHALANLEKVLSSEVVSVEDCLGAVEALEGRLDSLKHRATESLADERESADAIQRRIRHLKVELDESLSEAEVDEWKRQRVDRLIIEYLLRGGYYQTAIALAQRSRLEYVSNLTVFLTAQQLKVEDSLRGGETSRALEWCHDNRSKLRRLHSRLELRVREQEFIELLRARRTPDAIAYARLFHPRLNHALHCNSFPHLRHFKDVDGKVWEEELKAVNALIAYGPDTKVEKYAAFYSEGRWARLVDEFLSENFRLYQLAHQSVFSACLQSGLSALKTPECGHTKPGRTNGCPVCVPEVLGLGETLPFAHASHSRLVCAASGEPMDENNPSLMLPNGMVYGRKALQRIAAQNDGHIVCPRTGLRCLPQQTLRVFVM